MERWRPWRPKCGPSRAVRLRRAGGRCRAQRPEGLHNNNNSKASSQAEQSLEYRPKPNQIEPDLSRAEPS